MKSSGKHFSDRVPFGSLDNFNNLPRSRASKKWDNEERDSFDSKNSGPFKENYFVDNVKFRKFWEKILKKPPPPLRRQNTFGKVSSQSSSEYSSFGHKSSTGSFDYSKKLSFKTGLSKLSNAFVPSSTMPNSARQRCKNLRNLDCSDTMVIKNTDKKAKEILKNKCSKSGRIPNEMKYKTELCKNFMEERHWPYKDRCRFAHGYHELNQRIIINSKYRSRICESYHKLMYCPYGSRCLFRHYNYEVDFVWNQYSNVLTTGFLLKIIADAKVLQLVFFKLRTTYKENYALVTKKLLVAADPLEDGAKHKVPVYSRLKVFEDLTQDSQLQQQSYCEETKHLTVALIDSLEDTEYIHCKWFLKDWLYYPVSKIVKECISSQKHHYSSELPTQISYFIFELCKALVFVYRYPVKKSELCKFDNIFN